MHTSKMQCGGVIYSEGGESERGPRCTMYKENRFNRAKQRESQQAEVKFQIIRYTEVQREKAGE